MQSCTKKDHLCLLPYFYGNAQAKQLLDEAISQLNDDCSALLKVLNKVRSDKKIFASTVLDDCCDYGEDLWTSRLHHGLQYMGIECELTAELRGRNTDKAWKPKIPKTVGRAALLFHGAPDIIITHRNEGIMSVLRDNCVTKDDDDDDDSENDDGNSSQSSEGKSSSIQMGFQMPVMKSYKEQSFIPNKAGELVGAMHLTLVCRALRRHISGREVQYPLIGHGLLIHKVTGVVHLEVELGKAGLKVFANRLVNGQLTPDLLCSTISYLLAKLKD